jgi:hypothetical protein
MPAMPQMFLTPQVGWVFDISMSTWFANQKFFPTREDDWHDRIATTCQRLIQIILQLLAARRMTQFAQRFSLNLPNPFPGDPKHLTHFLQRARSTIR